MKKREKERKKRNRERKERKRVKRREKERKKMFTEHCSGSFIINLHSILKKKN